MKNVLPSGESDTLPPDTLNIGGPTVYSGRSSRRQFFFDSVSGLSSAWLAAQWPAILAAQDHAQRAAQLGSGTFEFLSPQDAVEVEGIASQVIPSEDAPGAREARVIYFIDRALITFDRDKQPAYIQGLKDLQHRTQELFPDANRFSSLTAAQQIQVLTAIEKTEFFELVRVHTIMGFLSKPKYGGNYKQAGWTLIGFQDRMMYKPPFGYYDAEENQGK
jgi:Gluconate 2-dehydrogenase subunit 3